MKKDKDMKTIFRTILAELSLEKHKDVDSFYGHMFIEDFLLDFSITFAPLGMYRGFYDVKAEGDNLRKLIENKSYQFLEYDLSKLFRQNLYDLIISGSSYVEIVLKYNADNKLCSIDFEPIRYKFKCNRMNTINFTIKNYHGQKIKKSLPKTSVLQFEIKELGYRRSYFRKIIRKLAILGLPDYEKMQKHSLSFEQYLSRQEFDLLKASRDISWNGRNNGNEYLNDIYKLYREIKFRAVKHKFLDYLLNGYNRVLTELGHKYGFDGEIVYTVDISDYKEEFEKLLNGEINYSQMSDKIYKR